MAKVSKKVISVLLALLTVMAVLLPCVSFADDSSGVARATVNPVTVHCYVSIDDEWTEIKTVTVTDDISAKVFGGSATQTRFYITAEQLEEIFGEYGFAAKQFKGELTFAHTDSYGPQTVWADVSPAYSDDVGQYIVPLGWNKENRNVNYLYYLPNGPVKSNGSTAKSFAADNSDGFGVNKTNSFYTIKVADPNGYIPPDQFAALTYDEMLIKGSNTDIVLPYVDGVTYLTLDGKTEADLKLTQTVDKDAGTVTVSVTDISRPVYIVASKPGDALQASITCYVAIDGEWQLANVVSSLNKKNFGDGKTRYYLTSDELEQVYGKYGFDASKYSGERIFPHADTNSLNTIWADAVPVKNGAGGYDIPFSFRTQMFVYYLPNNIEGNDNYFNTSDKNYNTDLITANSFFTIKCSDPKGFLTDGTTLPEDQMLFSGDSTTVTLPKLEGESTYKIVNGSTGEALDVETTEDAENKTITIKIDNIKCPVRITTSSGLPTVIYNTTVSSSLVRLGQFDSTRQVIVKDGTVKNQTLYYDEVEVGTGDYTLLDVDDDTATVTINDNNREFVYSFVGWRIGNGVDVYKAGNSLTRALLRAEAVNNEVTLNAVWKGTDGNNRITSTNFFVNLDCEIVDNMSNGYKPQHANKYTPAVFATRAFGTENIPVSGDMSYQLVAPATSESTAYEVDKQIRSSAANPISGVTLEQIPSDEAILKQIRESNAVITVAGHTIPHEDITSDYFTLRWATVKYEKSDGWHVDGVLVAKSGRLVVSKTFAGDDEAIQQVKDNGFNITVTHIENNTIVSDYVLSLNSAESETDSTKTGYTSYDAVTDTYTWSLPVRQGREYCIKEENYTLDLDKWNNTNRYTISNSDSEVSGWQDYPSDTGVFVTAEAYPSDVPDLACQIVSFQNMYVKSGLLSVIKADSTTGNGLKNVSFKLSKVSGQSISLYKKPNTSEYSTDTNAVEEGYSEFIADNTIITDANGNFCIKLGIHGDGTLTESYYLTETVPTGYEGPKYIKITVTDDGKVEMAQEVVESTIPSNEPWLDGVGSSVLTIYNRSKLLTSVKAEKQWDETDDNEKEPVTVELWRNGAKLTASEYTQVLSAQNNWIYEWNDLPLYIDGAPAVYSIREVKIGSLSYDAGADTDGYADYMVTYDATLYKEGSDGDYRKDVTWYDDNGEKHYADHAYIKVHNVKNKGLISFSKVDELGKALAGAKFGLYLDAECTNLLETVISGTDGFVVFPQKTGGTYYIKEIEAPNNYELDETVYKAFVRGGIVTITVNDGSTIPITKIVNKYIGGTEDFSFIKTNSSKEPLGGAEFALYKLECTDESHNHTNDILNVNSKGVLADEYAQCWVLADKQTSVSKIGLVSFTDLNAKSIYRLVEYNAPDGYKTPDGQWQLTFDTDGETVEPVITAIGNKVPAFEKLTRGIAPYRLYNYRSGDLPVSGNSGVYGYLAAGFVTAAAGIALFTAQKLSNRKNKKRK